MKKRCNYTSEIRDELIILDIVGEIGPEQSAVFKEHLAYCEVCQKRFTELLGFTRAIKNCSQKESLTTAEIVQLNEAIILNKSSPERSNRTPLSFCSGQHVFHFFTKSLAAALCIAILIFSGWHLYNKSLFPSGTAKISQTYDDEADIIANLDMLEELDVLEKLVKVLDEPSGHRS